MVISEHFADVTRVGEPTTFGHAKEKAHQPIGEVTADQQQMVVFQFMEQLFRREVFTLQRANKFECVFIRYHVGW